MDFSSLFRHGGGAAEGNWIIFLFNITRSRAVYQGHLRQAQSHKQAREANGSNIQNKASSQFRFNSLTPLREITMLHEQKDTYRCRLNLFHSIPVNLYTSRRPTTEHQNIEANYQHLRLLSLGGQRKAWPFERKATAFGTSEKVNQQNQSTNSR